MALDYLVGYAVSFALKIRIISQLMKSDSFPERKVAENFYNTSLRCSVNCLAWRMRWTATPRSVLNGRL